MNQCFSISGPVNVVSAIMCFLSQSFPFRVELPQWQWPFEMWESHSAPTFSSYPPPFRNQNFEPVTPKQLTDTHSDWERPKTQNQPRNWIPKVLRRYLIIEAFWGFNCASNFAFLRPFLFSKGICKVPRCNGLKILAPKTCEKVKSDLYNWF